MIFKVEERIDIFDAEKAGPCLRGDGTFSAVPVGPSPGLQLATQPVVSLIRFDCALS